MKQVTIVGAGMNTLSITQQGLAAIEQAEMLLGAPRMVEPYRAMGKSVFPVYEPARVAEVVRESSMRTFAVLVSGDTGFYSAADGIAQALRDCEITSIPGISSLNYMFATIKRPWQDAALLSFHGRHANIVDAVRRNRLTFALTGGNIGLLLHRLADAGFGELLAFAGENLGMENEHILSSTVSELRDTQIGPLSVLVVENSQPDARIRFGIPDEEFIRADVPMTKAEIRALTLGKLSIAPDYICCDIGAGTGAVTVEMALAAHRGHVFAIDSKSEAIELIESNCRKFHVGNVSAIYGHAPEALEALPMLHAAFIGGSSGNMPEIMAALLRNNPHMRIVVNAIALESVAAALAAFRENGMDAEVIQISVARGKPAGGLHMMTALNPVFMLSGGGHA